MTHQEQAPLDPAEVTLDSVAEFVWENDNDDIAMRLWLAERERDRLAADLAAAQERELELRAEWKAQHDGRETALTALVAEADRSVARETQLRGELAAVKVAADWLEERYDRALAVLDSHDYVLNYDMHVAASQLQAEVRAALAGESAAGQPCLSIGPRIGEDGHPHCRQSKGHDGQHANWLSDGWGSVITW